LRCCIGRQARRYIGSTDRGLDRSNGLRELKNIGLGFRRLLPIVANAFFYDGETVNEAIERAMHCFHGILRTRKVLPEFAKA
jgi:hypothetical protein